MAGIGVFISLKAATVRGAADARLIRWCIHRAGVFIQFLDSDAKGSLALRLTTWARIAGAG